MTRRSREPVWTPCRAGCGGHAQDASICTRCHEARFRAGCLVMSRVMVWVWCEAEWQWNYNLKDRVQVLRTALESGRLRLAFPEET